MVRYCFDKEVLDERSTVLDHLVRIGINRRIQRRVLLMRILVLAKVLNLEKQLFTTTGKLSEGNKRKVSLAIAMIASPRLLVLD